MAEQPEFVALQRESTSWWAVARRRLFQETLGQALDGKREGRVLDLGCAANLQCDHVPDLRVIHVHSSLPLLAFQQMEGGENLVCSRPEELAFVSNSFDAIVCGDLLQSAPDDVVVLRELRRVLKDGGLLCLTVPAYMFLWGEADEAAGNQRRYSASELRRKLNTCGFEIHRVSYFVAAGLVPSMIARFGKDTFKKTVARIPQSAETSRLANAGMVTLLDFERTLMHYINLPFGTRLVGWARKPALVAERVTVPAWERQWARQPLPQGSNYAALPQSPSAS